MILSSCTFVFVDSHVSLPVCSSLTVVGKSRLRAVVLGSLFFGDGGERFLVCTRFLVVGKAHPCSFV